MVRAGKRQSGSLFLEAQHQLRQPLNAISLLIGELHEAGEGRDRAAIIDDMRYALQLSNTWLDSLADLEKAELGLLKPQFQNVPLRQVFARLRDDFAGHFAALGLGFRIVECDAVVHSDAAILRRIITLLLDNAAKFTRQGKVLLGCRRKGPRLRIEVWDSGLGISESEQERLFDAFYRLENEVRPHERGLGIGLTYARCLSEVAAAELSVSSIPGHGSCFALALDLAEHRQDRAGAPAGRTKGTRNAKAKQRRPDTDMTTTEDASSCALPIDPLTGAKVLLLAGAETLRGSFETWGAEVSLATPDTLGDALRAGPDLLLADLAALSAGDRPDLLKQAEAATVVILIADPHAAGEELPAAARSHVLERPVRPARLRSLCHYALTHR